MAALQFNRIGHWIAFHLKWQWDFNNIADKQKKTPCNSEKILVLFNESGYVYYNNSEEETTTYSWIFHTYQTCHLGT